MAPELRQGAPEWILTIDQTRFKIKFEPRRAWGSFQESSKETFLEIHGNMLSVEKHSRDYVFSTFRSISPPILHHFTPNKFWSDPWDQPHLLCLGSWIGVQPTS